MPLPVTSAKATSVALDELVELLEAEADAAAEALEADELCASAPAARPRSIMREAMARERISGARQWWTEGRAGRGDANELTKAKGAATRVACHEGLEWGNGERHRAAETKLIGQRKSANPAIGGEFVASAVPDDPMRVQVIPQVHERGSRRVALKERAGSSAL